MIGQYAQGAPFELPDHSQIQVQLPENWKAAKGLFGLPIAFYGPDHAERSAKPTSTLSEDTGFNGSRTVVSVIPGVREEKLSALDPQIFKNQIELYQKEKREEMATMGATLIEFLPNVQEVWSSVTGAKTAEMIVHRLGVKFSIGAAIYHDYSYHLVCNSRFYLIKVMYHDENQVQDNKQVNELLRSFGCDS